METIVVGMSGGVDSSVAAYLLKEQGYRVIGLFMHNWEEKDAEGVCCATEDYEDVKRVCDALDIPYYSVNFSKIYYEHVFEHFLSEYRAGRTPNPDVLCNREVKFKPFLEHAKKLGADKIATGHYCGLREENGLFHLERAADTNKDQTYFLNQLSQAQLSQACFPLAQIEKPRVRDIAARLGLATAKKKDSTGICFIGERNFRKFLSTYLPNMDGDIVDCTGRVVGRHTGLMYYTTGQRRGLGIGGDAETNGGRWFVVAKDLPNNRLIVSCGDEMPLYTDSLEAGVVNWIPCPPEDEVLTCLAQVRYRQPPQEVLVTRHVDGTASVRFAAPQRAVAEGQYVVFYNGRDCLGGAVIERVPLTVEIPPVR